MKGLVVGLFVLLLLIVIAGVVYVNKLASNQKTVADQKLNQKIEIAETKQLAVSKNRSSQFYNYFMFPFTIQQTEDSSDGTSLIGIAQVNLKDYPVRVFFRAKDTIISVHTYTKTATGDRTDEQFKFMSVGEAISSLSVARKELFLSIGLGVNTKPKDCDSSCRGFYAEIEKYQNKNNNFSTNPQQTANDIGAVVEISYQL